VIAKAKRRPASHFLEEFSRSRSKLRVDRDQRIIYRIKILGFESVNNTNGKKRRYTREAAQRALPMYDGAKAYSNHPPKNDPTRTRENEDALGIWRNPTLEADGVYADLHYLESNPTAQAICEDAERGLGAFGASHNADGMGDVEGNEFVVGSITEVRSIDVVTDPATVKNLWESRAIAPKKVKVHAFLTEHVLPALVGGRKKRLEKLLIESKAKLLEADVYAPDDHAAGKDYKDHLYAGMRACEEAGDSDTASKIHGLMKPAKPEDEEEGEMEEGDGQAGDKGLDDKKDKTTQDATAKIVGEKPTNEGRQRKPVAGAATLTESRARSLCELASIPATPATLNAVIGLTEAKAVEILKLVKMGLTEVKKNAPRSEGYRHRLQESAMPSTAEDQAKLLLS
jgi:hypothetical protein